MKNNGQEKKAGKEMTEMGHNLDLLRSNLTVKTGLICLGAIVQAAVMVLLSLTAGIHQHRPPDTAPETAESESKLSGGETVWLCFLKRLACHM